MASRKYFGTDGIRGRAGRELIPELVHRAAYGLTRQLGTKSQLYKPGKRPLFVAGHDTRLSSPMLHAAVVAGLMQGGADVLALGVVPTPLVPLTVLKLKAAGGVMVTASHNPIPDNGIKLFNGDGIKLNGSQEKAIEQTIDQSGWITNDEVNFGAIDHHDPTHDYLSFIGRSVRGGPGRKLKIVLDCACGATSILAPEVFKAHGYGIVAVNAEPDGSRVNVKCGATDLKSLSKAVKANKADLGLAFDGDGDRMLAVDELGQPVSGDKIIALLALKVKRYRDQRSVVMTQMTNMGVEEALKIRGISMLRTEVGDINVLAGMVRSGLNLGGEQSGHIILRDKLPAGDGILAGMQLAHVLSKAREPLSVLVGEFGEYPQKLTNLKVFDKQAWKDDKWLDGQLKSIQRSYRDVRFYLRPSGTENVVRVLTEAQDKNRCLKANQEVCLAFNSWDKKQK